MDIDDNNNNNNNNDEKNNSITSSSKYVNKKIHSILLRNGCFVLLNLSSSSFGPQGSFKVMKANQIAESVIVSSISSEIFSLSNLTRMSPLLKLVIQLFSNQVNVYGDSGHFFIQFCCSLVIKGSDLIEQGVQRSVCVSVYKRLLQIIELFLQKPSCPFKKQVSIKNMQIIRHIVRNIIVTKNVSKLSFSESNYISTILLQAVLQSLASVSHNNANGGLAPSIRYIEVAGQPVNKSIALDNTIMMDLPIDSRVKQFIEKIFSSIDTIENLNNYNGNDSSSRSPLKVVIFDMALTSTLSSTSSTYFLNYTTTLVHSDNNNDNIHSKDKDIGGINMNDPIQLLLKQIFDNQVRLILSQKTIDPRLQEIFMKNNIIPIERLSIRHIKAIASISGAKVLSDTHIHENDNHIFSNAIGEISGIHMVDLFSERYLLVKGYSYNKHYRPVSTLVLCSHSEHAVKELTKTIRRTVKVVTRFFRCPYVIPGAGAFEFLISDMLEKLDLCSDLKYINSLYISSLATKHQNYNVEKLKRQVRLCKKSMIKSFHDIIVNLFGERSKIIHMDALIEELSRNNNDYHLKSHGNYYFGCNIKFNKNALPLKYTRKVFQINDNDIIDDETCIMDVYLTKIEAIRSAVEVASILLRTNGTIHV